MKKAIWNSIGSFLILGMCIWSSGCGKAHADPADGAPPPARVEEETNADVFKVDHPEQFPLATAAEHDSAPQLNVTGTVSVDISRNIPVVTIASGRITEIHARLGDHVTKGQLLVNVQSQDISQAFSDYRQALADQKLAKTQLDRAQLLFARGAMAQKDLEVAQDQAEKAEVTVETTLDHLKVLGADPKSPTAVVEVHSPATGVITDQQVTAAAGTQGLASPNMFTISDLSHVWIMCDVYENDLSFVKVGEYADIHLNAYPGVALKARISNIGAVLDPNLRTAKVRLEIANPGERLRVGMFVTATFHSQQSVKRAVVPATAILHLHDRDWVYVPMEDGKFHRVGVVGGNMLADNQQEISGIEPGQKVVQNALAMQATVEQVAQ
ncbi:MAG TPA: efflux RND transporter periplasmic adaptor subunit [Blastocatellia bacterium]|nr:efflux RND transporter periplasmic adaptor subunit [Blastocatellia bacterium]